MSQDTMDAYDQAVADCLYAIAWQTRRSTKHRIHVSARDIRMFASDIRRAIKKWTKEQGNELEERRWKWRLRRLRPKGGQ